MIDTIRAIVLYVFLVLGVISFVTMVDELLLGGVISDAMEWFLDKVADIYWYIADIFKRKK